MPTPKTSSEHTGDREDIQPRGPAAFLRVLIRRRLRRLPCVLQSLGAYLTIVGKVMQLTVEQQEVLRRAQRRMRAEGLIKGRDDARARAIVADELTRYRAELQSDVMKFEISSNDEAIDPWKDYEARPAG